LSEEQTVARKNLDAGQNVSASDFHTLDCYLGKKGVAGSQMAYIKEGKIQKGDIYLLCSDGVARSIRNERMAGFLKKDGDKAIRKIYDKCRKNPYSDNCTAVILKF